jgi:hypothetical protein
MTPSLLVLNRASEPLNALKQLALMNEICYTRLGYRKLGRVKVSNDLVHKLCVVVSY